MKGPASFNEVAEAKRAIEKLGGGIPRLKTIYIEWGKIGEDKLERNIVVVDKTGKTSSKYPRNPAIIKKQTL